MDPDLESLVRGTAAGLIIAAPVGPVNVLCIKRTLEKGWKSGMVSGFGAAVGDTVYGGIAGFSISLVIRFLIGEEFWIRLIGGMFLMGIGAAYFFKDPPVLGNGANGSAANSDFVSALLLNAANPTTVLSFLAVLATLGLGGRGASRQTTLLVAGIFGGSMAWWTFLIAGAEMLRSRITNRTMYWMNRVAGIAIGGFGLVNVALSRVYR